MLVTLRLTNDPPQAYFSHIRLSVLDQLCSLTNVLFARYMRVYVVLGIHQLLRFLDDCIRLDPSLDATQYNPLLSDAAHNQPLTTSTVSSLGCTCNDKTLHPSPFILAPGIL